MRATERRGRFERPRGGVPERDEDEHVQDQGADLRAQLRADAGGSAEDQAEARRDLPGEVRGEGERRSGRSGEEGAAEHRREGEGRRGDREEARSSVGRHEELDGFGARHSQLQRLEPAVEPVLLLELGHAQGPQHGWLEEQERPR